MKKSNKPRKNKSGNERGVNRKGNKNLEKIQGGVKNRYGVTITDAEKRALESKVNSANRKRKLLLNERNSDIRTIFGVPQDYNVGDDFTSRDFLFAKKTKSLQRFKTKADYNRYIGYLDKVLESDYIAKKLDIYKKNYITSIEKTFNSDGDKAIAKIAKMNTAEFAKLMNSELYSGISYVYSYEEYQTKLEALNAIIGVK